ncbi:MAG: MFS transporter, partial [Gammaproteobacteria bacterium]|jgi:MFS family permease
MEGLADAAAALLKLYSGRLADRGVSRKGLILSGYGSANLARPLIGLAGNWPLVLGLRFLDRVGKGLRTSPRDAVIADAVETGHRGRAFGFHRGMDHAGAMIGPLAAFALLQTQVPMTHVFYLSAVPGVAVLLLLAFGLRGEQPQTVPAAAEQHVTWRHLDTRLQALLVGSAALALASVPEVFLVLWAQHRGLAIAWVPLIWAAAHAVKSVVAIPAGAVADGIGRLPVVVAGWSLRVVLLLILPLANGTTLAIWGLFLIYAGALALTEAAERALIGDVADPSHKATAFGIYHMLTAAFVLPGALLFGSLWQWTGERAAFWTAALLTAVSATVLLTLYRRARR